MAGTLKEKDWDSLLPRIEEGKCTPFFGAGACFGVLPLGSDIAQNWSKKYDYPLQDKQDLVRVAQYLAVQYDPLFPKEKIIEEFAKVKPPDFSQPDEPHSVFADLPLPLYMTTNYDDFMLRALSLNKFRDPKRDVCQWNATLSHEPSVFANNPAFAPSVPTPLVFHLHGHAGIKQSMVLTEDDYLKFLAALVRNDDLLPAPIRKAMAMSSFLFVGYRLADWNFRVLFQGLRPDRGYPSIAVLVPPGEGKQRLKAQEYLNRYYGDLDLRIYWGTAREFALELRRRWKRFRQPKKTS